MERIWRSSALLSADVRGSRPKATERGMKAIITLLYAMRCASSSQCRPPPCVPLRAHLAGAFSLPCEVSARGCGALHTSTLSSSLSSPLMLRQVYTRHSGAPTLSSFTFEKKSENAATRDTHRSTRTAQHELRNATRQDAAAGGANAESEGAGKARQGERSELCDGELKEKERVRGRREEREKEEGRGKGLGAAGAPLT